jgi:hypothetical protein
MSVLGCKPVVIEGARLRRLLANYGHSAKANIALAAVLSLQGSSHCDAVGGEPFSTSEAELKKQPEERSK